MKFQKFCDGLLQSKIVLAKVALTNIEQWTMQVDEKCEMLVETILATQLEVHTHKTFGHKI